MHKSYAGASGGFTLVELMVTVAIVAILGAIAYPAYRKQVVRAQRTEAKVALSNTAQGLERCFTRFNTYMDEDADGNPLCEMTFPFTTGEGAYQVSVARDDTTFTLTATAQGGQAVDDTQCGNFTLTQANVRGISGDGTVQDCWGR